MNRISTVLARASGALVALCLVGASPAVWAQDIDLNVHLHFEDFATPGQQADEIDLIAWGVEILDENGTSVGTATSDATGDSSFVVNGAGSYTARLTLPDPYPYDAESFWPNNLDFPFVIPAPAPITYNLRVFLGCGCNDADSCTLDSCRNGVCAFALDYKPEIPEVCDDEDNDCDGKTDEGLPPEGVECTPQNIGCADATREGFMAWETFPLVASCGGAWTIPDPTGPVSCNRTAGNHGVNPSGAGCGATDLCAPGWHVCYGPDDVAVRTGDSGCMEAVDVDYPNYGSLDPVEGVSVPPGGAFFATRATTTSGVCADGVNAPMDPPDVLDAISRDNVFGCGNMGAVPGQECGGLNRAANELCAYLQDASDDELDNPATDYGYALLAEWGWSCGVTPGEELANLVKLFPDRQGGVMCCRDTDPELPEVCDGVDNDGDGLTDESDLFGGEIEAGGTCAVEGQCGTLTCTANGDFDCVGLGSCNDQCDGVDNDNDGSTDEDYIGDATTCGTGVCASTGMFECVEGEEVDSCTPGDPAEETDVTCDGLDGDCDGETDEEYTDTESTCGFGACERTGTITCEEGDLSDSCTPGTPLADDDATCDNVDDDCDNQTDEDYAGGDTTCGVGYCARTGEMTCSGGIVMDSCEPGDPLSGNDATCDGVDDDCDESTDEDFVGGETTCGTGVCASTGTVSCEDGVESSTCEPGEPLSDTDTTCDGVDDDCDGETDEDFEGGATTCGEGVCASTGTISCVDGVETDTCEAGEPASTTDDSCDNLDSDCDGETDEEYEDSDTTCGVGACSGNTGTLTCVDGVETDSCDPTSGASDEVCDGEDNDCDGETDEDFPTLGELCDGPDDDACVEGTLVCAEDGSVVCDEAGPGKSEICDGQDNDCDGQIDEGFTLEECDPECPDDDDCDDIPNAVDNCINVPNANQVDTDGDGFGDVCDVLIEGGACNAGGGGGALAWALGLAMLALMWRRRRQA